MNTCCKFSIYKMAISDNLYHWNECTSKTQIIFLVLHEYSFEKKCLKSIFNLDMDFTKIHKIKL
jgi:hypothetical protein